jgi:hypothetical protein
MASETSVQTIVHKLEEGGWKPWILRGLVVAFLALMIYLWMFKDGSFKGLSHERAMEQAQISREIARGHGFTTKVIRPAALFQFTKEFTKNQEVLTTERLPDTYHAPLNPLINAPFLWLFRDRWTMTTKDIDYVPDRVLVFVQFAFMIAGWAVSYFTMKHLFDAKLAAFGLWLMILCQTFWDFAVSGLPQNLIFFLFSCALYAMVRAVENKIAGRRIAWWLSVSSFFFGLMALAHGLTLWIFAGAMVFALLYFPPLLPQDEEGKSGAIRRMLLSPLRLIQAILAAMRFPTVVQRVVLRPAPFVMLVIVLAMYIPWMVRNARVCGNPVGLGWYSGLYQIKGTEDSIMRSMEPPFKRVSPNVFRSKVQSHLSNQTARLLEYLGGVVVAPVFFLALLHVFRRRETADFRWAILSMWLFALFGMSVFGLEGRPGFQPFASQVEANDMHILFVPMFAAYGMAFILVMWSRIGINVKLVRWAFVAVIFMLSGQRFLATAIVLRGQPAGRVQWPPYIPPFIAILGQWTTEREIIASDMPWAVAWYADRKSLWIPMTVKDFLTLNDENRLNGRIVGLYLTPYSGNRMFVSEIIKGDYKEWAPFIMRNIIGPALRDFPLRAYANLPMDNECIFYADRDRWSARED